jgi:hypothetical protein
MEYPAMAAHGLIGDIATSIAARCLTSSRRDYGKRRSNIDAHNGMAVRRYRGS